MSVVGLQGVSHDPICLLRGCPGEGPRGRVRATSHSPSRISRMVAPTVGKDNRRRSHHAKQPAARRPVRGRRGEAGLSFRPTLPPHPEAGHRKGGQHQTGDEPDHFGRRPQDRPDMQQVVQVVLPTTAA